MARTQSGTAGVTSAPVQSPPRPHPTHSPISGYESPDERSVASPGPRPPLGPRPGPSTTPLVTRDPEAAAGVHKSPSEPSSLDGIVARTKNMSSLKVGLRDRIGCYQWTWFTMNMATGGVANLLFSIPYRSGWLNGVGLAFFFLNIFLFFMNCVLITLRFRWRPGSLLHSFTDQFESLFIPAFVVSVATILITTCQYGVPRAGPWLIQMMEAMFWIYVSASTFASTGMYLTLWSTQVFPIHTMTPIWVFPAYPLLLTAPFGANLISAASTSGQLKSINTIAIAMASVTVQGTGFLIAFMIMAAFLYRLMTQKLPRDAQRPGVFISVGPSGFTSAGLVQLGYHTSEIFPTDFMGTQHAVFILRLMAYMAGLWLWGLSIWFFLVSVGSLWKYLRPDNNAKIPFQMTWFSFVFPNTALVTATEQLGRAFDSNGLQIFGCVLAVCIILVWILVFTLMIRCLWLRQLLWPKEED
ncbi:voltage-dependent anion channel-domain-containing protein [Apodospora peruviana]|uniref:Voltage-dependent anion channel-domain-containing protein n=1 Tax=Apodospora peruviana TaxID=516989 RepID=A0AAE0HY20_9PEZI|nr:voltage-dependent anion channel-domain-containing protein [Apodospora peruviana]